MKDISLILGNNALDNITGFSGVITAVVVYLNGTQEALVEPPISSKNAESRWINTNRLNVSQSTTVH